MTVGLHISSPGSFWNTESLSVSSVFTVCWARLNWDLNFLWSSYEGVLEFRWPDASFLSRQSLTCISVIRDTKKFPRHSMLRESRDVIFRGRISQSLIIVFHRIKVLIPVPVLLLDVELHVSITCPVWTLQLPVQSSCSFWEAAFIYSWTLNEFKDKD